MVYRRKKKKASYFNMQRAAWKYAESRAEGGVLMSFYKVICHYYGYLITPRASVLSALCAPALSSFHLTLQFLADLESNPLLRDSMKCQRLLMEGMKYHLLPQRRPLLQSPRTRPRKATVGAMFAVGGMDATKGKKHHCAASIVSLNGAFSLTD